MYQALTALLTQALWLTGCGVVFYRNLGDGMQALNLSKFNQTLNQTVGETIALIDWANKSERSQALQLCEQTVILDGSTNQADIEQLFPDVNDLIAVTILTVDRDGTTGCRETIKLWLPMTRRLQQERKPIKILHICKDIESTSSDDDPMFRFAYRSTNADNIIDVLENKIAPFELRLSLAQFVEQLHYRMRMINTTMLQEHLADSCPDACRSTCAHRMSGPLYDTCQNVKQDKYLAAEALIINSTLANITIKDCKLLTVEQRELLSCGSPISENGPSIRAFVLASLVTLLQVILYILTIYLHRNSIDLKRSAAIDGLICMLINWMSQLVWLPLYNPSPIQEWLANNHKLLCTFKEILQCALAATCPLPVISLVEPLAGTVARSLAALFFVVTLTISLTISFWQDIIHACDEDSAVGGLVKRELIVTCICLLLAAGVVGRRAFSRDFWKLIKSQVERIGLVIWITDLLLSVCRLFGTSKYWTAIILSVNSAFLIIMAPLFKSIRERACVTVCSLESRVRLANLMSRLSRSPVAATSQPQPSSNAGQIVSLQMDELEVIDSSPDTGLPNEAADQPDHEHESTRSLGAPSGSARDESNEA